MPLSLFPSRSLRVLSIPGTALNSSWRWDRQAPRKRTRACQQNLTPPLQIALPPRQLAQSRCIAQKANAQVRPRNPNSPAANKRHARQGLIAPICTLPSPVLIGFLQASSSIWKIYKINLHSIPNLYAIADIHWLRRHASSRRYESCKTTSGRGMTITRAKGGCFRHTCLAHYQ